jgi:hypothetical protein
MQTLKGPTGLLLVIDDTNSHTPVMVYDRTKRHSSTYHCAVDTWTLDSHIALTDEQVEWLGSHEDSVDKAFNTARAGNPDYM